MISNIKKAFLSQVFIPKWYSVAINSNYFIARGISYGIKENANYMKGKMLDFGCGTKPYRSLFKVDQHIGVDIEKPATDYSERKSAVDKFYDGRSIPFDNEYFDSVFSSEVLTHIFHADEIIMEICRVLKNGGYILFTVPFVWKENEQPYDSVRYTSFGIKHLLEKHGFDIVVQQKKGNYVTVAGQLFNDCLFSSLPKIGIVRMVFTLLIIFPLHLIQLLLSLILPKNEDIFQNNIIVAQKKGS